MNDNAAIARAVGYVCLALIAGMFWASYMDRSLTPLSRGTAMVPLSLTLAGMGILVFIDERFGEVVRLLVLLGVWVLTLLVLAIGALTGRREVNVWGGYLGLITATFATIVTAQAAVRHGFAMDISVP